MAGRHNSRSSHSPFFFADLPAGPTGPVVLQGSDARHLAVVRRAAPQDHITVGDGRGTVAQARLVSVTPARVEAAVISASREDRPTPAVHVLQALAKGEKVDSVIRQLVELGVDTITIFESGRSVARWDRDRADAAATRWAALAHEAAKQSRRRWLPRVLGPLPLSQAVAGVSGHPRALGLIAHPGAPQRLAEVLTEVLTEAPAGVLAGGPGQAALEDVWVVVGPEGGLTPADVAAFAGAGGRPVGLGEQILRTETAGVVIASLVLHRCGRLG